MSEHENVAGDELDRLLRDAVRRETYIDDAGFTARVMGGLPAAANFAWRRWILLGFAVLAVIFGLLAFGGGAYIWDAALDLVVARRFGTAQLGVLVFTMIFCWMIYTALSAEQE